jgi:hypothetical protein
VKNEGWVGRRTKQGSRRPLEIKHVSSVKEGEPFAVRELKEQLQRCSRKRKEKNVASGQEATKARLKLMTRPPLVTANHLLHYLHHLNC